MKTKLIENFEYILEDDDEVIGIITENKKTYEFIFSPRNLIKPIQRETTSFVSPSSLHKERVFNSKPEKEVKNDSK